MITIRNLYKSYKNNQVFKGLNLDIHEGTTLIVGDNEAGKTTLCKILCRIMTDFKGEVLVDEQPVGQQFNTIMTFEQDGFNDWNIKELYEMTNIYYKAEAVQRYPIFQLRNIDSLSKGEFSLINIDLVCQLPRKWIFLDEPLDGLDEVNRDLVKECIQRVVNEGKNVILVTHEVECVEYLFENVIFLHDSNVYCAKIDDLHEKYGSVSSAYQKWREGNLE